MDFEVYGKVQGVFFRKHTQRRAKQLGVVGFCRNTPKGTVKGRAQAPHKDTLLEFREWLSTEGSPKSRIDECIVTHECTLPSGPEFHDFEIRK